MSDDFLVFKDEEPEEKQHIEGSYSILIVDDDPEIHSITRLVLKDFVFDNKDCNLISAYTAAEAKTILQKNTDIAVILLDVVMEEDHSGLELVDWIREDLKNSLVRIILRTGQPGIAPERSVITKYEINDYKSKTELTNLKLYTTITSALRGYRDLKTIKRSKEGFEKIISASGDLYSSKAFHTFYSGVLTQLTGLLRIDDESLFVETDALAVEEGDEGFRILAATGEYSNLSGRQFKALQETDEKMYMAIKEAIEKQESRFSERCYIGYFKKTLPEDHISILTLRTRDKMTDVDREIVQLFAGNVAMAFTNITLQQTLTNLQREMIFTLGEVIETRSHETGNHVRRVGEIAKHLALQMGISQEESDILEIAIPLHDIGKIGVPDDVLNKPALLTPAEREIIKTHTTIGYNILNKSSERAMRIAGVIAYTHHERWDGQGYPRGLKGNEIPLEGQLASVADVIDALAHPRVYKGAWPLERVFDYLLENRGSQFNPEIIDLVLANRNAIHDILQRLAD